MYQIATFNVFYKKLNKTFLFFIMVIFLSYTIFHTKIVLILGFHRLFLNSNLTLNLPHEQKAYILNF